MTEPRTLAPMFPTHLVEVREWIKHSRPGTHCELQGNWVWVRLPEGTDPELAGWLKAAGFKASLKRPGWWFHIGHRWRPGDAVHLPPGTRPHYVGHPDGITVLPFGPLHLSMRPGVKAKNKPEVMGKCKGVRLTLKNDRGQILVIIDWNVRNWHIVAGHAEVLLARLEDFQASAYTLKAWQVPPPRPPDFVARVQRDLVDHDLFRCAVRRQHEYEAQAQASRDPLKQAQNALIDTVHDPNLSLQDKARAELRALAHPGATLPDQVLKTARALLSDPSLILPNDLPQTLAELEAKTGPTPEIR